MQGAEVVLYLIIGVCIVLVSKVMIILYNGGEQLR